MSSDESEDDLDYVPSDREDVQSNSEESVDSDGDINPTKKRKSQNNDHAGVAEEPRQKTEDELWSEFLGNKDKPAVGGSTVSGSIATSISSVVNVVPSPVLSVSLGVSGEAFPEVINVSSDTNTYSQDDESSTNETVNDSVDSCMTVVEAKPKMRPMVQKSGVSSLLDRMKEKKASTLEKSRQDWEGYKSTQGITEELSTHNRGKGGYLEKKEFLERTDYRQFEKERDLRLSRKRQAPLD